MKITLIPVTTTLMRAREVTGVQMVVVVTMRSC
jgi:hypothetical protein